MVISPGYIQCDSTRYTCYTTQHSSLCSVIVEMVLTSSQGYSDGCTAAWIPRLLWRTLLCLVVQCLAVYDSRLLVVLTCFIYAITFMQNALHHKNKHEYITVHSIGDTRVSVLSSDWLDDSGLSSSWVSSGFNSTRPSGGEISLQ